MLFYKQVKSSTYITLKESFTNSNNSDKIGRPLKLLSDKMELTKAKVFPLFRHDGRGFVLSGNSVQD